MRISSECEWETPRGRRAFAVSLDDGDGAALIAERVPEVVSGAAPADIAPDEYWWQLKSRERFVILTALADRFAVAYAAAEGAMSGEYAKERLAELDAKIEKVLG